LGEYVVVTREIAVAKNAKQPRIILVSPSYIDDTASGFIEAQKAGENMFNILSADKSRNLAEPIKALANKTGCDFLDAGLIAKAGDDGVHLTAESHGVLAEALAKLIS